MFYLAPDGTMVAVPVIGTTPIEFGKPARPVRLNIMLNWVETLKTKVAAK